MLLETIRNSKKQCGAPAEEMELKVSLVMPGSGKGNSVQEEQNLGGTVMAMVKWIMVKWGKRLLSSEGSPALFWQNHFKWEEDSGAG